MSASSFAAAVAASASGFRPTTRELSRRLYGAALEVLGVERHTGRAQKAVRRPARWDGWQPPTSPMWSSKARRHRPKRPAAASSRPVCASVSDRSYPGEPRFTTIKTAVKVVSRSEYADRCTFDTRFYISSAACDIDRLANGARRHWGVESMHWLLDVEFKDDLSRYRSGHGSKNMAIVRRFALSLVRADKTKRSVKTRRKSAGWNPNYLLQLLQLK